MLTLINRYQEKRGPNWFGEYLCDCGKTKLIRNTYVTNGHTRSCGCLYSETSRQKAYRLHQRPRVKKIPSCHPERWHYAHSLCQYCYNIQQDRIHPESKKRRVNRWIEKNKQKDYLLRRRGWLRREYGLTLEQYDELLQKQGGRCAICKTTVPGGIGSWHVDHDHATGKIRGLLCFDCNICLGRIDKNKSVIQGIIDYYAAQ